MVDLTPHDRVLTDDGRMITLEDLPPAGTTRWISRRKADVVAAVRGGLLTVDAVLKRYNLTAEEFDEWTRMFSRYGTAGLRATRLRHYRMREQAAPPSEEEELTLEEDETPEPKIFN